MASAKPRTIALWALSLLLALMFLLSGSGKLANAQAPNGGDWDGQFVAWGYPDWFRVVVGASEAAFAILLLAPRTRFYGAAGLVGVMLGACLTHVANGEGAIAAAIPLGLAVLAAAVAWMSQPAWVQSRLGRKGVVA